MKNNIIAFARTQELLKQVGKTHEEYLKIITDICEYEVSVYKTPMPALNFPPDDTEEILKDRQNIINAMDYWNRQIFSGLTTLPDYVKEKMSRLCEETKSALEYVGKLENCGDKDEYEHLVKNLLYSLEDMMHEVDAVKEELRSFVTDIETFKGEKLDLAYTNMADLVERLKNDESIEQNKVNKLMSDIHKLQGELNSAIAALVGSCIAVGASIAIIVLGAVFCGPEAGVALGIFLGIPALIGASFIAINSIKIEEYKQAIKADENEMNLREMDIAMLQIMAEQYAGFMDGMSALKENVSALYDIWNGVATDIKEIHDWIEAHNEKGEIENWLEMKEGLNGIVSTCGEISETTDIVDISDLQVSMATLELGMSSEEVEKAVKSAETVPFLEYVKAV